MNKKFKIPQDQIQPLVPPMGACLATDRILVDGQPVRYMYREKVRGNQMDSGWRFFAGDESDKYLADHNHTGVYDLNTLANYDPDIIPHLQTPAPCAFEKIPNSPTYRPVAPPEEE